MWFDQRPQLNALVQTAVRDGFDSKREPGMDHGQIGEGFQDSSEPTEWPILPRPRPRQAQRRPSSGGERPHLIEAGAGPTKSTPWCGISFK